jgi:PAS domain S-box-containing protein
MKKSDQEGHKSGLKNTSHLSVAESEALIRKISSAIHNSLNSDKVLQTIVNEIGKAIGVCRCRLALFAEGPLPEEIAITHEFTSSCCANRTPPHKTIRTKNNPALDYVLASETPFAVYDTLKEPKLSHLTEKYLASTIKSIMSHAIRLDGKPIGIFSLHTCENHQWTQSEIDIVKSVTEQAAVAIRQTQLYKEATEAATKATLVNHIVASIRGSLNLQEILKTASEELGQALHSNRAYFCKFSATEATVVANYFSDPAIAVKRFALEPNNFLLEYIQKTRKTFFVNNLPQYIQDNPEIVARIGFWKKAPNTKALIASPIFVDEELWGAVVISTTEEIRNWNKYELELVEAVKAQVEVAIKHCRLFEEAQQATKVEALIRQVTQSINQTSRLDDIYKIVALELGNYLAVDALLVTRLNETQDAWNIECAYSQGKAYKPMMMTYDFKEWESLDQYLDNGLYTCNNVETDPHIQPYLASVFHPGNVKAFMSVTMVYPNTPRFSIVALSRTEPRQWTDQEKAILRAAAGQMVIAVERAELFDQVSRGKDLWEATFDALNDGLLIFDENGMLSRANEAAAVLEGSTIQEMIGRKCCTLLHDIEAEECRVLKVIQTGIPVTFDIAPQKLSRPVLVTISPIQNKWRSNASMDKAGGEIAGADRLAVHGAVCIIRDLSEVRAAEASARAQRGFLVNLIEHATDSIFALSKDGKLIWCNNQFEKMTGYGRDDLFNRGYQKLIPAEKKELVYQYFYQALAGESQTLEIKLHNKNEEEIFLLITFTPIFDEGSVTSLLLIARDITEEKLASERAARAEKMRALGQITAGVAHNFNNILAAILGHAQLLKRNIKEERLSSQASIIERAALDGAEMVKRIQSFGNQQKDAAYESVDINQLIQDSITLTKVRWQDEAQARGLYYEVASDLKPLPPGRGSSSEIREVFVNMILNSLDAMPGGGLLHISTISYADSIQIQFLDSGVGMSEEVRKRIFEPFFTTKGPLGTGLGLAVSYSAIERHGGTIEVTSALSQGSLFTITLPVAEMANSPAANLRQNTYIQTTPTSILVIDDDKNVRGAMVEMLKDLGFNVEEAESGYDGIERIEQQKFDLVMTDLSMPGMDGWAVAAEIRKRWPQIKIVMVTGHGSSEHMMQGNRALLNRVISKPVRMEELNLILTQLVNQR